MIDFVTVKHDKGAWTVTREGGKFTSLPQKFYYKEDAVKKAKTEAKHHSCILKIYDYSGYKEIDYRPKGRFSKIKKSQKNKLLKWI